MTIRENLIYFLKNGRFENINFAITKEEFIKILGEPESYSPVKNSIRIYVYNNFEFYFWQEKWKKEKNERLACVVLNYPQSYSSKSNLQFKSYSWTTKLPLEKALHFLNKHNIKFEEVPYSYGEDYRVFKTEGNVHIGFIDFEENGNFKFYKISREVELSSFKPITKQISFEVEKTYHEQLRKEAEKTKISISNLCREIIEKHLEHRQ